MAPVPPARYLLRGRDLADARYFEPIRVADMARAARLSPAHFSREFRRTFGESPHRYLLTRRLERAAALLRTTDRTVADICFMVGLGGVGSFTTSFRRVFGVTPTAYRASHPPASRLALIPRVRRAGLRPWVHDQDEALAFYTQKVCLEVRADVTVPEMGNFRWLTVGPAGQPETPPSATRPATACA